MSRRYRWIRLLLAAAACAAGTTGCFCLPAPDSVLALAAARARLLDPQAIVFQANGVNGASLRRPGESVTLEYSFLAIDPDEPERIWSITYDATTGTWRSGLFTGPIVGANYYDLTQVTMGETRARALLAAAGHEDTFYTWTLYKPLFAGANPLYVFTYAAKTVSIDTLTEEVAVLPYGPPGAPDRAPGDDSVSLQYIAAADARIKEQARSAMIIWAGGRAGSGVPLETPGQTDTWDFYAMSDNGSELAAWWLTWTGTWSVTATDGIPWGIEFQDMTSVGMDVVEAWDLAVDAGYLPPFESWQVFKPLNPNVPNPVYVFPVTGGWVIVDTVTGEVTAERNTATDRDAWECLDDCRNGYLDCVDACREHAPGDPDCYDECSRERDACDAACLN
mgnify:CR=1 FL=1